MGRAIKQKIKNAALSAFPALALKLFSIRSRRMIESRARELRLDRLARDVSQATGGMVAADLFAGMRLDYELFPVHASPNFSARMNRNCTALLKERSSFIQNTS